MYEINVKVDYVVTKPLDGFNPKVTIFGHPDNTDVYRVYFYDKNTYELIFNGECRINQTIVGTRQWHTDWVIHVVDVDGNIMYVNEYDPTFKKVYIKIDAYALGDNIAWMPYLEEYRKKYNCDLIVSTFHNHLFQSEYPDILFVPPNTVVENLYSQFYIGATSELNVKYSPVTSVSVPLQMVATATLGLNYIEMKPRVGYHGIPKTDYGGKYVCLSEFGSTPDKSWKHEGGWQTVVNHLNDSGYKVVVISKEPTELKNVIDKTGDIHLSNRIADLEGAEFYLGVSSGLAWLSWEVGTHVIMVSDVTPWWHEFQSGITRICTDRDLVKVDYSTDIVTHSDYVVSKIIQYIENKS
jgi:autotransporter strand-loop-strand O-heptosyltransferase